MIKTGKISVKNIFQPSTLKMVLALTAMFGVQVDGSAIDALVNPVSQVGLGAWALWEMFRDDGTGGR